MIRYAANKKPGESLVRSDWVGAARDEAVIAGSDFPRGKDPRSINYPFLGAGYAGDAVRCRLQGDTLVCRLTRKYRLFYWVMETIFGPYLTAVGVYELRQAWIARSADSWTSLLLPLCVTVIGLGVCFIWIAQLFFDSTIKFDFAEGFVEFRTRGLFACRWRFRLQTLSEVTVERRIRLQDSQILLTEEEYAARPHAYHVDCKVYWLVLAFADGRSVKAFETSRSEVADFAAQCIIERLTLPSSRR